MGANVARMQQPSAKSAKTLTFRYHFTGAYVLVHARLDSLGGGSVSDDFGAFTSSDLEGD